MPMARGAYSHRACRPQEFYVCPITLYFYEFSRNADIGLFTVPSSLDRLIIFCIVGLGNSFLNIYSTPPMNK